MNAKERLKRIIRAQNSLLKAKTHLQLAQNSIRKEYDLCVREAAAADGFVADCDERIERAGSWDGAQPDAYFGKLIKWRRCDRRDVGQLVRVSTQPVADPADMEKAVLIGLAYGPDGDISGYQCEGSKGQTVHWLAAWTEMKPGEELQAPPSGRKFTRIHIDGVDFGSVPQKWVPDQGKVGSCSGQGSANAHKLNRRLWDVIADKWKIRPLDVVVLRPPAVWAKWPGWSALHDQILTNQRMVIDPEALAMVSPDGEIAIRILGFWVNVECFHVLAKDYHWEPTTFGEALLANRPPEPGPEVTATNHSADASKMVAEEPAKEASLGGLPDIRTFAQPNLRWRILEPGELIKQGDWYCLKSFPSCKHPAKGNGWLMTGAARLTVSEEDACVYARPVFDEPAKEPEHPAGPVPDPGEGYRLLSKDPPEELQEGDQCECADGTWGASDNARTHKRQAPLIWYRRKIDVAKEPEPPSLATVAGQDGRESREILPDDWIYIHEAYRDVTPADVGKLVIVRNDAKTPWIELRLAEVTGADFPYRCTKDGLDPTMWQAFRYALIWNEQPASSPVGEGYRRATRADIGKQCEFSDGSMNPDGSLVWGIFSELQAIKFRHGDAVRYYTEEGSYYDCRFKVEG